MPVLTVADIDALFAEQFPQAVASGTVLEAIGDRWSRLRQPIQERHLRPGGTVSGPTLMGLADRAVYTALLGQIGMVPLAVTTSLHIDFLRKPEPRDVIAKAELLKLGKRLAVGSVTMYSDGSDEPIAHATVTYSIPPR